MLQCRSRLMKQKFFKLVWRLLSDYNLACCFICWLCLAINRVRISFISIKSGAKKMKLHGLWKHFMVSLQLFCCFSTDFTYAHAVDHLKNQTIVIDIVKNAEKTIKEKVETKPLLNL